MERSPPSWLEVAKVCLLPWLLPGVDSKFLIDYKWVALNFFSYAKCSGFSSKALLFTALEKLLRSCREFARAKESPRNTLTPILTFFLLLTLATCSSFLTLDYCLMHRRARGGFWFKTLLLVSGVESLPFSYKPCCGGNFIVLSKFGEEKETTTYCWFSRRKSSRKSL